MPVCDEEETAECGEDGAPACADGLVCAPGEPDVCLSACDADDDCPLSIERCEDGTCRLREALETL